MPARIEKEREEKHQQAQEQEEKKRNEDRALMEILAHQKEQIDILSQGIKAAQEDKLQHESKALADALAQLEAKKSLNERYHKKHAKAIKKIKNEERKKRKKFAEDLQYYNLMYNNPYNSYMQYGGMPPIMPRYY